MACSKKYMDLVVTASGYTPAKLWPGFLGLDLATASDFNEWRVLAVRLRDEAYRRLYELADVETARAGELASGTPMYPRYSAMREPYEAQNTIVNELNDMYSLGSLWQSDTVPGSFNAGVQKASQAAVELACVIEQIDTEIAKYGVTPRALTDSVADKEKSLGIVGSILLAGGSLAIIGGTIYVAKKLQ